MSQYRMTFQLNFLESLHACKLVSNHRGESNFWFLLALGFLHIQLLEEVI